jgi:hypothetical protein
MLTQDAIATTDPRGLVLDDASAARHLNEGAAVWWALSDRRDPDNASRLCPIGPISLLDPSQQVDGSGSGWWHKDRADRGRRLETLVDEDPEAVAVVPAAAPVSAKDIEALRGEIARKYFEANGLSDGVA